ncbi:MAG: ComF family protein [Thiohalocapsa sp.]
MHERSPLDALRAATALLFPPTCALCGAPGADGLDICRGCRTDLPVIRHGCSRCALPLPQDSLPVDGRPLLCGACQRRPPPFDHCHAAYRYEDPLPALVGGFKFRGRLNLLRLLGLLLADSLRTSGADLPDAIVPVPLHPERLRQRGYNQALELSRVVGRRLKVSVDDGRCARVLATRPQADLDKETRRKNLRGAFAATANMQGAQVAILDDVVTTGSTVTEMTRVLRRAGCRRVDVWTVARTP